MPFLWKTFLLRNCYNENIDEINQDLINANRSYRSRGIRTGRYKYFVYYEHDPIIEELYDVENDPFEQNNLANNDEYTIVLQQLRKQTEKMYLETLH